MYPSSLIVPPAQYDAFIDTWAWILRFAWHASLDVTVTNQAAQPQLQLDYHLPSPMQWPLPRQERIYRIDMEALERIQRHAPDVGWDVAIRIHTVDGVHPL